MKNLTDEEKEVVKRTISSIVDNKLSEMIGYELEGSDFTERLMNELPDFEGGYTFERIVQGETTQFIDSGIYHSFLNDVTNSIFNDLKFE